MLLTLLNTHTLYTKFGTGIYTSIGIDAHAILANNVIILLFYYAIFAFANFLQKKVTNF